MNIQERYTPIVVPANSTVTIHTSASGCFLCTVTGTVTLIANADGGAVSTQVGKATSTGSSLTVSQTASVANAMAATAWR